MSMPSLSIVCYKNGFSFVNIPVKLEDDKEKEENKVRLLISSSLFIKIHICSAANVVAKKTLK